MAVKTVKHISKNKWTESKDYHRAHEYATDKEKKKYPKQFKRLTKWIDKDTKKDEYVGMNYKSGKIEEEKKVPVKYRKEIKFHEKEELKKRRQLKEK